ncbi:ATP-binding protein [Sulfurimonas lithotrophica]|uniref:ATP-binding protein n=1 Tax=Sulfurimonas lithotrophica TaxID=2590022 RepID=A0A5P8NZZ0_9BACT|nr:ATP-binding protein [Sulfurimonas lithotrophica]QFR49018.1 ATP-binding protein [Sulfurimonas lithotrophica]
MKSSIYTNSKDVFIDAVNPKDYVQLDRVSTIYQSLKNSVKKPLKMILLYGKPGTGKSMFLSKLHQDLSKNQEVHYYMTPIIDESEFYRVLAHDLYGFSENKELNFTQIMKIIQTKETQEVPLILLDEAQLYSDSLMEKIRLLSDTRKLKFVIALHKTQTEDLIAKEHFQTRIWESVELKNASMAESKIYIQKKLMKANCFDSANMFTNKSIKLIYKLTNGNYRDTNKLLYSVFEIYEHYYKHNSSKISMDKISNKIIEMSAIHTGLIDA